MPLHRLTSVTIGVPDVDAARVFYRDFGLAEREPGRFATAAGGEQLRLMTAPRRNLLELGIGVDDPEDLGRIAARLERLGVAVEREARALRVTEPVTGIKIVVEMAERIVQPAEPARAMNGPGRTERSNDRSPAATDAAPARPRNASTAACWIRASMVRKTCLPCFGAWRLISRSRRFETSASYSW